EDQTASLFALCDRDNKGFLTEADLKTVCPQLDDNDIAFIFASLDTDGSGRIERDEFCSGFLGTLAKAENNGYNGMHRRASVMGVDRPRNLAMRSPSPQNRYMRSVHEEEVYNSESDSLGTVNFALPCQEEVLALYEQLQNAGVPALLKKYERVVGSFCKELKDKKEENQRLQHVYENERDMYNRRMEEVETEIDQQLMMAERRAREEEHERLTREKEDMRRQMESEMREMRSNIERLQRMEHVLEKEGQKLSQQKELQAKLQEISCENHDLKRNLAENHVELAMIKSEMAHTRADYEQRQNEFISERRMIESKVEESENMQKQLQLLFDANRKLHDTNESLRDALDTRSSVFKQFNIRTPSPTYSRDGVASRGLMEAEAAHARALLTSASASGFITDEDGDSGLALQDGYLSSDLESEKPRGDFAPLVGFNEANGPAERTFRIVMCGDASVGKSSLVMRIIKGTYTNNLPSTLGVDFHVKTVNVDGRNVALQLWDTAGQERFRSLCKSYFRRADGAILVYDVTSEQSFLHVRDWIETIKESVERHIPIIMCGNKTDLRLTHGDAVSNTDGSSMAAAMSCLFMETSALDGSNVEGAMLTLSRELMAVEDVEIRSTGVVLTKKTEKSSCFKCAK
ncbi:hypothetical protein PFISCL1PPCAC_26562, partial [Pristionchus fissidentatus]